MVINSVQSLLNDHWSFNLISRENRGSTRCSKLCASLVTNLVTWPAASSVPMETGDVEFVCLPVVLQITFHSQSSGIYAINTSQSLPSWYGNRVRKDPLAEVDSHPPKLPRPPTSRELEQPISPPSHPFQDLKIPSGDLFSLWWVQLHKALFESAEPYSLSKRALLSFKLQNVRKGGGWRQGVLGAFAGLHG